MVFGKVIEGMDVVHAIENVPTDSFDGPTQECIIANAGTILVSETFDVSKHYSSSCHYYLYHPDCLVTNISALVTYFLCMLRW